MTTIPNQERFHFNDGVRQVPLKGVVTAKEAVEQSVRLFGDDLHVGEVVLDQAEYDKTEKERRYFTDGVVARHNGGDVWSMWNSDGDHYEEWFPGTTDPAEIRDLINAEKKDSMSDAVDICAFANHMLLTLSIHENTLKSEQMVLIAASVCGRLWGRHMQTCQSSREAIDQQWADIKDRIESDAKYAIETLSGMGRPN